MAISQDHIDSFHRFASEQLGKLGAEVSMDDLYDQWRLENPTEEEREADVRAVKASLRDMEQGDRGKPFGEHLQEMREKFGLSSGE